MKVILNNKKLTIIISILLVMIIAAAGFWQYHNAVSVEASGVVSININQGSDYAPGQEIISQRTENSKKFFLSNSSYALDISIGAIHYKDDYSNQQEPWKDIDLTFKDNKITQAPYILSVDQAARSLTVQDKKTGKVTTLALTKIGNMDITTIGKTVAIASKGKIQWNDVVTDLDLAVTAENTQVRFDWIVKSEKAPHQMEFQINDGGIPISYKGTDADGQAVNVTAQRNGNKIVETIQPGGKYPKIINPIIDVDVNASENDCQVSWNGSSWYFNINGQTDVGYCHSAYYKSGAGLRFTNITIPANSAITSSYISIQCICDLWNSTVNSRITGDKENNPAAWSTLADYQSRRGTVIGGANNNKITTTQVNWDNIGSWNYLTWYNSPNISSIIQELVNAHAPNNEAIALFWDDFDNRSTYYRTGISYDNGSSNAPKLHIEYTVISNTPSSYNFGQVEPNASPSTGLNYFTVTNNSGSIVNITISGTDLTGGTTWTLSDTATPGATTAGIKAGLNGGDYNIIVKKTAPFNTLKSSLGSSASQGWGLQILAPTGYTDSTQKNGSITLTASAS